MSKKQFLTIKMNKIVGLIDAQNNLLDGLQKENISNIANKIKYPIAKTYLDEVILILYVKNLDSAIQEITEENIHGFANLYDAYLILKLYYKFEQAIGDLLLSIVLVETAKKHLEQMFFMNSLQFLALYCNHGITVDVDKIENILSGKNSDYFINARKSKINTILGIKNNKKYNIHPDAKNRIIPVSELSSSRFNLKDKHINVACPVCHQKFYIDKNNIANIIVINRNMMTFNCQHLKSSCVDKPPFHVDLSPYLNNQQLSKTDKQIFALNNLERLTHEA